MISCPNCGKDIADDSVHCGYCGAEIETGGGKKTMMGFAPVTPEMLRKAAEEAKEAREAREKGEEELGAQPSESKLKIPKPSLSSSSDTSDTSPPSLMGPGKLTIPKPGGAPEDRPDAKTEVMQPVDAESRPVAPATIEEKAPEVSAAPSVVVESQEPSDETDWAQSQTDPPGAWKQSPTDPPGAWKGPAKAPEESWSMGSSGGIGAESTSPELIPDPAAPASNNPLKLGEPLPGGGPIAQGQQNLPAKSSNKKFLIPVIVVLVLFGMCCVMSVLYGLLGSMI